MKHTLGMAGVLLAIWLLNSGHYTPLILLLGAVSIAVVITVAHFMDVVDNESLPIHLSTRLLNYWLWLFKELVISNIDVVKRIWIGKGAIYPVVKTLPVQQKSDIGKVIYANSITLTPGTVTVDLQDEYITVHALSREGMEALESGDMGQRVARLER